MDNTPESSQPLPVGADGKSGKPPVKRRARTTERQVGTGRWVKSADSDERRRLSAEMKARGAPWSQVADAHWSGDRGTAMREVKRWYAQNPSEDVLTQRRIVTDGLDNLEAIVRDVMQREHYVVSQRGVVLDAEGKPLIDDQPIYQGVDRILKIKETLGKFVPGLLAPKVTAEISGDAIEAAIAQAEADYAAELAQLATEEGNDEA